MKERQTITPGGIAPIQDMMKKKRKKKTINGNGREKEKRNRGRGEGRRTFQRPNDEQVGSRSSTAVSTCGLWTGSRGLTTRR